jgi:hypothetical protein
MDISHMLQTGKVQASIFTLEQYPLGQALGLLPLQLQLLLVFQESQ